jgi:hypothetical protein
VDYRVYAVSKKDRAPLVDWLLAALRASGCSIIHYSALNEAPFRITFETPAGERLGIVCYVFFANTTLTKNRPADEWRFQIKYGSRDGRLHELWQDPYGLYTTLFMGVNPGRGFFVGADPAIHSPTRFFISLEFKEDQVRALLTKGWHAWERDRRGSEEDPVEVLIGGTGASLLRYILFEREARGVDQGHRQLLAESLPPEAGPAKGDAPRIPPPVVHALAAEFQMSEREVLDLVASARMLKMAVRGWVAEKHLADRLSAVPGVSECHRPEGDAGSDVELRYRGSRPLRVQCKNVLRAPAAGGVPRVDFQRTRASKADPCSRYYSARQFDVVAACLHAMTLSWEFKYVLATALDPHTKCVGRLSSNVRVDSRWSSAPEVVLADAAQN